MEDIWKFRGPLIKVSIVVATFFSILALAVMTIYAGNKVIIVDNVEIADEEQEVSENNLTKWKYDINSDKANEGQIVIPLEAGIAGTGIETDIRYEEASVTVSFATADFRYYQRNIPFGDFSKVKEAYGEYDGGKVHITFFLNEPSACETSYNNLIHSGEFSLVVEPLNDIKEAIVLVDPAHGGNSLGIQAGSVIEKEVLLKIAEKVKAQSVAKPYRVILSRTADINIKTEEKVKLASLIKPDYYIGLELSSDIEDVKLFGMHATYNDGYYRNGIQNVEFADMVLKNTCNSTSNRGNDLMVATEADAILMTMDVPGVVLYAGYLSNPDECRLLGDDEYLDMIAAGIIDAIDNIYN